MDRSPSGKVAGREFDSSLPVEMEQLLAGADSGKGETVAVVAAVAQ